MEGIYPIVKSYCIVLILRTTVKVSEVAWEPRSSISSSLDILVFERNTALLNLL